jgi:hypothetical protein
LSAKSKELVEVKGNLKQGRDYSERAMKYLALYYYCEKATHEIGGT